MGPFGIGLFFFSAWLTMIFWGIIAPGLGIPTISYVRVMLVTLALWLVLAPLALTMGWRRMRWMARRGARHEAYASSAGGADEVNLTAVFSGSARTVSTKGFKGGKITAVFEGVQLDLRGSGAAASEDCHVRQRRTRNETMRRMVWSNTLTPRPPLPQAVEGERF